LKGDVYFVIMYQALSAFGTASGKKLGRAWHQSKYCWQHFIVSQQVIVCSTQNLTKVCKLCLFASHTWYNTPEH